MSAASTVVLVIPDDLINKNPKKWKRADVLAFLEANKEEFDLDDEDIDVIRINKVAGYIFLKLTKEELLKSPYSLPGGPAAGIEDLIKELIHITSQEKDELQKEAPTTSPQDVVAPTNPTISTNRGIPRSYRTGSGTTSFPGNQSHKDLDEFILEEIRGTVYVDVTGFETLFNHVNDIFNVKFNCQSILSWVEQNDKNFEIYGQRFLADLSNFVHGLLGRPSDSQTANVKRFYYGSGGTILVDAYHQAQRKCDIFLSHRLPDDQHQAVMDKLAQPVGTAEKRSPSTPKPQKFSWRDVLVVGEFKSNKNLDTSKDLLIQLGGYVREVFGAQPGRRFVHAFTVCGHLARLWMFDRAGVSGSESMDLSQEMGQESFIRAVVGYMTMSPVQLGFCEQYKDSSGEIFVPHRDVAHPPFLEIGGKRMELLENLGHWSPTIVSRATLCWKAKMLDTGSICVIKDAWRDHKVAHEAKCWQNAQKKGVIGCLEVLEALDAEVVCKASADDNNIRRGLGFDSAKLMNYSQFGSNRGASAMNKTTLSIIQSDIVPEAEAGADTVDRDLKTGGGISGSSKKRRASSLDDRCSKRPKLGVVEARVHNFMVMKTVGEKLADITSPVELLEVLRDAIKCHQSLYEKAGILHCDISINNIMKTSEIGGDGLKGFLIDLDYAQQLTPPLHEPTTPNTCTVSPAATIMTGTPPFMALEILLHRPVVHTWRHDLESFLYVLVWICVENPRVRLSNWCDGLKSLTSAGSKRDAMSNGFDGVLGLFDAEFEELKPLATKLREILFYASEYCTDKSKMYLATPPGETARKDMYEKFLAAFDVEIDRLNNERERICPAISAALPGTTDAKEQQKIQEQKIQEQKSAEWVQVGFVEQNAEKE